MKTVSVAAVVILLALASIPSGAQMDLAKALVGKWEGDYEAPHALGKPKMGGVPEGRSETARTLVIGQVRQQEGKWIAEDAKYGISGKGLNLVPVMLEMTGGDVILQFRTAAGPDSEAVKLQLSKEKLLAGTIGIGTGVFHKMELKKVE
jgi:hypothetical protein